MSAIDDMMAQFQISDEERRKIMIQNALLGLGAGLLDSRGKNVWPSISTGLLGGMQMGQQAIGNAQQGMVAKYKLKRELDDAAEKKLIADAAKGRNEQIGALLNKPDFEPKRDWQQYVTAANIAFATGDTKTGNELIAAAEKFRPKYSATPHTVMGPDGPVMVQTSEYDAPRPIEGYAPKPEIELRDMGGRVQAVDKLRTPAGSEFAKSLTPGDVQQQAQWEQEQRLRVRADQRAAAAQGGASKPQLVDGQWVYAPDAQNPAGRAVPVTGMKPKEDKPTDQQLTAAAFASRMNDATKIIEGLEKKNPKIGTDATLLQNAGNVPLVGGVTGPLANVATSMAAPGVQSYLQGKRAWIRAKLRKESGAVIGVEEEAMEDRTFFPQVGDSPQVIKQKAQMRRDVERSLSIQSRGKGEQDDPLGLR